VFNLCFIFLPASTYPTEVGRLARSFPLAGCFTKKVGVSDPFIRPAASFTKKRWANICPLFCGLIFN
jgi:hypothetical protein